MMALEEQEIARRVPVWAALAELFLDTELQDDQYRYIAEVLRASGYSPGALQTIFSDEVAPVFHANLAVVAGEWQDWSADMVKDRVLAYLRSRPTLVERLLPAPWLRSRRMARVQERWEAVLRLLAAL